MYQGGYSGKIMTIDLSNQTIKTRPLDPESVNRFIGGAGINTKLAYDGMGPDVDALSEESLIIFGGGVFQGTAIPGAAKVSATFVMPSNNQISTGMGGGSLGFMLKLAGYDHVMIKGRSEHPSYITIFDDDVRICDARHLWGKDLTETTDLLWDVHGGTSSVFAVGKAGERLIPFSLGLLDKAGNLGKGGLGAAMGSKNLKALVVQGTKGVAVADRRKTTRLINDLYRQTKEFKGRDTWIELGLLGYWDGMVGAMGGLPAHNSRILRPVEELESKFGIPVYRKELQSRGLACPSCTLNDKFAVWPKGSPEKHTFVSSFLGVVLTGSALGTQNYKEALQYHDMLNRHGFDKHTTTCILDYAVELYEKGKLRPEETDNIALSHNLETCKLLINQMLEGRGVGGVLAGGWRQAIETYGEDTKAYAVQIKGTSPAMDPRLGFGTDKLAMITGARSQAARGGSPTLGRASAPYGLLEKWALKIGMKEQALSRALDKKTGEGNMSRLLKYAEDWIGLFDCLGLCGRPPINRLYYADKLPELYTAVTGIDTTAEELLTGAERLFNLERLMQDQRGFTRKEDKLPQRFLNEPLMTEDGKEIFLKDFYQHVRVTQERLDDALNDYYLERGWDMERGAPTGEKLSQLGLS